MEIIEYQLISVPAEDNKNLTQRINDLIRQGWQPYQAPCTTVRNGNLIESQAVVRYKRLTKY